MSDYNYAYLDEQTKRMIRRAILKGVAVPGYQVPFASREMPMPYGWGMGGVQVSAACLTVDAMLLVRALHSAKDEPFERWTRGIAVPGLGISLVAVTWQALPALLI